MESYNKVRVGAKAWWSLIAIGCLVQACPPPPTTPGRGPTLSTLSAPLTCIRGCGPPVQLEHTYILSER